MEKSRKAHFVFDLSTRYPVKEENAMRADSGDSSSSSAQKVMMLGMRRRSDLRKTRTELSREENTRYRTMELNVSVQTLAEQQRERWFRTRKCQTGNLFWKSWLMRAVCWSSWLLQGR